MNKNILIIGPARSGKTTLSRLLSKKYGYNVINLDDIINAFEGIPECGIKHDGNEIATAQKLGKFLKRYLIELSEGPNFYNGIKFVIEGTHIDFEEIMPMLNEEKYKEKYEVIGLLYNNLTADELYNNIKKYDTEDDWTYWCNDEELKGNSRYFIERNKYFYNKFNEYGIKTYDISSDREKILNIICNEILKK